MAFSFERARRRHAAVRHDLPEIKPAVARVGARRISGALAKDGKELFFLATNGTLTTSLMAAEVDEHRPGLRGEGREEAVRHAGAVSAVSRVRRFRRRPADSDQFSAAWSEQQTIGSAMTSRAPFVVTFMAIACVASLRAESAAGVKWAAPAGWTAQGPRPMRAATYAIAPEFGEKSAAECGIYFFGTGQGGSVDDNIARWKGQFTDRGGVPAPAKVAHRTLHGLAMTTVDVSGEDSGSFGGPLSDAHEQGGRLPSARRHRLGAGRQHFREVHRSAQDDERQPAKVRAVAVVVSKGSVRGSA